MLSQSVRRSLFYPTIQNQSVFLQMFHLCLCLHLRFRPHLVQAEEYWRKINGSMALEFYSFLPIYLLMFTFKSLQIAAPCILYRLQLHSVGATSWSVLIPSYSKLKLPLGPFLFLLLEVTPIPPSSLKIPCDPFSLYCSFTPKVSSNNC